MNAYIEIQLLPDPEFPASTLTNALFNKLHKSLFDLTANDIAVSFPEYGKTLGHIIRLHGSHERLQQLEQLSWMGRMQDYCQTSTIQIVPIEVKYCTFGRLTAKYTDAKLRRLLVRHKNGKRSKQGPRANLSPEDILAYNQKKQQQDGDSKQPPYLLLKSSKGQTYKRSVIRSQLLDKPKDGTFDTFGLSKTATVPWF